MAAILKWLSSPAAEKAADAAKAKAQGKFKKLYPNVDMSKFTTEAYFDSKNNATADVLFKEGPGSLLSVSDSDSKYWSKEMKNALGLGDFPVQLTLRRGEVLPIPAVGFTDTAPSLKKLFNADFSIYVTPEEYFTTKFREIFQKSKLEHTAGAESKKWLAAPNMSYWPQQLNFAVWCASTGCGISREIFDKGSASLSLPVQVRAFYLFHVYFTVRRILYQLGGIQSISALPEDPTFSQKNNHYNVASYKRLCNEFGVDPSSDFRFTHGANHGLGSVYIYVSNAGPMKTGMAYPGSNKFSDEGGAGSKGNLIYYIEPDDIANSQFDWFAPNTAPGLTQVGMSRVNQSIEAFVYCVLGAQVNVRSSILGSGGRAKEAQSEFLVLLEDAIRQPDLSKSVQRYQLAVDEAKVRLNLAVCPGAWLMPARLVINTESTVGYNNRLMQATKEMKLGINDGVNTGTKKVGVPNMAGGPSKTNRPNSHPSNPIHKAAVVAQSGKKTAQSPAKKEPPHPDTPSVVSTGDTRDSHETNKIWLIAGLGLGVFALSRAW